MQVEDGRRRVVVLSLGGTIASTRAAAEGQGRGVTPRLTAADLVAAVPAVREAAEVDSVSFRQCPSGDLTMTDLVELAAEVTARVEAGADGVVVTQGTDTLEETAFALDLLLPPSRPVVVTGAMRNPTLAGPDGPANLLAAVQVAACPQAAGLGCLVVLDDEIHGSRFVRKTHTSSTGAFRSGPTGPLGWLTEGRPRIAVRPAPLPLITPLPGAAVPPVALLTMSLGDDGRLAEQVLSLGYAGLVVQAFGGGHVPHRTVPALERLAHTIPVVLASRTGAGEVLTDTYGFPGAEQDLIGRGLVPAGFLDGVKARVLLSLALAAGLAAEQVREVFARTAATVTGPPRR
ncbi:MAG: asparaginase [Mycobacteriales bacterium]